MSFGRFPYLYIGTSRAATLASISARIKRSLNVISPVFNLALLCLVSDYFISARIQQELDSRNGE